MKTYVNEDFEDVLKQLDKVRLWRMKHIRVESVLYFSCFNMVGSEIRLWSRFKTYLSLLLKNKYKRDGDGKLAFLISTGCSQRKEFLDMFQMTASVLHEREQYKIYSIRQLHFEWRILFLPIAAFVWFLQMYSIKASLKLKLFLILELHRAWIESSNILKKLKKETKLLTVFCDVTPAESMVVQRLVCTNIVTTTLQHGHFNTQERGWVYQLSKSDYFLVHGSYAKNEAIKSGLESANLVSVGMMNLIGKDIKEIKVKKGTFGVFLNGPGAKEDNEDLIKLANYLARKTNLRYTIRCHPAIPLSFYKHVVDREVYMGECSRQFAMDQYIEEIAFALVGNSTSFIEILLNGKMAFRFVHHSMDIYEGIDWCKVSSAEELLKKYDRYMNNEIYTIKKIMETRCYLCEGKDNKKNYIKFFKQFL